jgi:hypothetical protein
MSDTMEARSTNWPEGTDGHAEEADRPLAMAVFAGRKPVVVEGSRRMGLHTAAHVVAAASGSVVIIGPDGQTVDDTATPTSPTSNRTGPKA